MEVVRSIPLVLADDPDLRATVAAFGKVRRALSEPAFNGGKPLRAPALHAAAYHAVKGRLNAQMTCSAVRSVASAYAAAKANKKPAKRPFAFLRDTALFLVGPRGRDASFKADGTLSVWTVNGRKRIGYAVPTAFAETFTNKKLTNSLTVRVDRDGKLRATLAVTLEAPDPLPGRPVGVDLNETNAVVASHADGRVFFSTGRVTRVLNRRTTKTLKRVKAKGLARRKAGRSDRSVRRVLKRLRLKRTRRTRDFARVVARQLVKWAGPRSTLVVEELKFRQGKKTKKRGPKARALNRRLSQWPRGLIRQCITDRAALVGLEVVSVNPAYTSQTCSVCGRRGERRRHAFSCVCGHEEHSDVNAARNIRQRYVQNQSFAGPRPGGEPVNLPRSSDASPGKPPALAGGD